MEREEVCEGYTLKNQVEAFEEMISEVPFPYSAGESKISILNRSPEVEISQEQPPSFSEILLAKPDTIFSGAKRKAITLIEEVTDKPSLSSAPVKNVMEWNCELCEVCTTSKDGLNDHLQGKNTNKSKFIQLVERPCKDMISGEKSEEGSSSPNNNDPPSLLIDDNADDMRNNTDHEKQNIRGFTFWLMEAHNIGKKHKRKEENKNCSVGLSPIKPQFIQIVEHPSDDMISGKKSEEGSLGTNNNDQP
ncbi:hypothetical protein R3W88_027039 [Solanum pinnatisectum]|uniref:C2H2-type domain-containing protein n=1 Tax=Solanum pinnatisectum TaxID=50273 RepID=A0AAV9LHG5_9SOLN|nr:hypothetical protein R3W88_027039 [Solanum pinnatisectum]